MKKCCKKHVTKQIHFDAIESIFATNQIEVEKFFEAVDIVFNQKSFKRNTLFFRGPSNSGKTLLTNFLLSEIDREDLGFVIITGENQFELSDLLGKKVAVFHELFITPKNVQQLKLIFGGEDIKVDQKFKGKAFLDRIPCIVTTNNPIKYVSAEDKQAIENRCFIFEFKQALIELPKLCSCHWKKFQQACQEQIQSPHNSQEENEEMMK